MASAGRPSRNGDTRFPNSRRRVTGHAEALKCPKCARAFLIGADFVADVAATGRTQPGGCAEVNCDIWWSRVVVETRRRLAEGVRPCPRPADTETSLMIEASPQGASDECAGEDDESRCRTPAIAEWRSGARSVLERTVP